jgi:thiol-disulfide isomerase/thioredoxin
MGCKGISHLVRGAAIAALACGSAASVALAVYQIAVMPRSATAAPGTPRSASPAVVTARAARLPEGSYPVGPLAAGTPLPLMEAAGWIHGAPQQPGQSRPRLVVLDIWSHWCNACRQTAPGLVRLHEKFAQRDVSFVSLTNVDRQQVESFASHAQIPWSCGYGASLESLSQFGAYSTERFVGNFNPGHEVMPTIYVIGADGRILWHDEQSRPRHLKDTETLLRDLEAEIERLLAIES